ncbi:dihydroxyacetone kinase phosphoryl donor subunit DhaM [Clostridium polynesiense]|uniref:dihydroxyacetone kinase phosphoryl donor subunit DhaM n=1 Tax=Clostridium polynesiense TaxID=1325933 RepID=UPI00058C4F49|nr:dihydroxyacetone kinase phosphoryl donor subunit DhaM [Clostridium polynesiense]
MMSLVLLSHSRLIVQGLKALIEEMAPEVDIFVVGGTPEGGIGSDYEETQRVINEAYRSEGVVVLFDLGSTFMTAEMIIEEMEEEKKQNIKIMDAPLVEGGLTAAIAISGGGGIEEVYESLKPLKIGKII